MASIRQRRRDSMVRARCNASSDGPDRLTLRSREVAESCVVVESVALEIGSCLRTQRDPTTGGAGSEQRRIRSSNVNEPHRELPSRRDRSPVTLLVLLPAHRCSVWRPRIPRQRRFRATGRSWAIRRHRSNAAYFVTVWCEAGLPRGQSLSCRCRRGRAVSLVRLFHRLVVDHRRPIAGRHVGLGSGLRVARLAVAQPLAPLCSPARHQPAPAASGGSYAAGLA